MPRRYRHLSEEERDKLAIYRAQGWSLRAIARKLGRDPATLSRELKRNAAPVYRGCYWPHRAHTRADRRNRRTHRRRRLKSDALRRFVEVRLRIGWSPELIAGRLRTSRRGWRISYEAIYQWIYREARHLIPFLARSHRKRLERGHSRKHTQSHIPERVSITRRPAVVARRLQAGHWEADTVVSRRSLAALQVVVERKARFTKIKRLSRRSAAAMRAGLNRTLARFPQRIRRSITYDNGTENVEHQRVNQHLGTRSFFSEPHHPWEKGTVENTIGLIRRFLPKKTDFAKVHRTELRRIEQRLNHRPRKCLGFKTPSEVFRAECCT